MAYPRYIGKSAFASGAGDLSVAALTGTQAGDIILLFVESANQTISTPSGYSVLATQVGTGTAAAAGGVRIATFYRILADAADTSTTVSDSGNHTTAIKMLFRDTPVIQGNFFVAATSTQGTASTSMTFPAVTTATDESLVILSVALDTDADSTATVGTVTNANLSNITEIHDQTVSTNAGGGLAVITGEKATAGSTGTSTATGSTSVTRAYTTIALSRVANQTSTSTFNDVSGSLYTATSDALLITAGSSGTINAVASGTYTPDATSNGQFDRNFRWYYRQYGTDTWTKTTAVAQTVSALVVLGAVDTVGEFSIDETITGLTNGVTYEFVLFSNRGASGAPDSVISFSGTAEVSLPPAGYTITADGGTFSYTGGAANTLFNKKVAADAASFSYSGNTADLKTTRILTADSGSYAYTGTVADLEFGRKLTADAVSFALTGQNAGLLYKRLFQGDAASFAYNGQDVSFKVTRALAADTGLFSYGLGPADLIYTQTADYTLTADAGNYVLTGNASAFNRTYVLAGNAGSYSYSGTAANLLSSRKLIADTRSYSYTGQASTFAVNRRLSGEAVNYALTGQAATFRATRQLVADTGGFTYSGSTSGLYYNRKVVADSGSFAFSLAQADFIFESGISKAYLGTVKLTDIRLGTFQVYEAYVGTVQFWGRSRPPSLITAQPTSFIQSGSPATFRRGRRLSANGLVYSMSNIAATLTKGRPMSASSVSYTFTGQNATLTYTPSGGGGGGGGGGGVEQQK